MRHLHRKLAVGALLLAGTAACADLDVANPNDANQERALSSAGDVVSLISSSYNSWFTGNYSYDGPGLFLSNASFQHTAPWANGGMEFYGRIPRQATANDPAHPEYLHLTSAWYQSYRAIAGASEGLRSLEDPAIAEELTATEIVRAQAFGKFVLANAHATLAILFDNGFIVDETVAVFDDQGFPIPLPAVSYQEMLDAALGYFDQAIALAEANEFEIPTSWLQASGLTSEDLALISHSFKARYRAAVARTPEERAAVDWTAVIADVRAGITEDFSMDMDANNGWYQEMLDYGTSNGWSQSPYFIYGMADQSGNYQAWLDLPISAKDVNLPNGDPVLIVTPDLRFPQGATLEEQQDSAGIYFETPTNIANVHARPDRGTWRWSYYKDYRHDLYNAWADFTHNEIDYNEMRLLEAEGLYRQGQLQAAADLINVTRVAAGLNATDAAGTNTSCVPRLPDESCGDLFEMLKWEKRLEVVFEGLLGAPWYFDSRGWGDLWIGTPLQFPVPCKEVQVLSLPQCNSYGGLGGDMGSPGSNYDWPHEGA